MSVRKAVCFYADPCASVVGCVRDAISETLTEAIPFRFAQPSASAPRLHGALTALLAAVAMLGAGGGAGRAEDAPSTPGVPVAQAPNQEVTRKLERMEGRVRMLERQLQQQQQGAGASAANAQALATAARIPLPSKATPASSTQATGRAADSPKGSKGILGLVDSPAAGLAMGAYGEIKFGAMQNPAAAGQWQNGFDAARFVLLPTYAITDNIIFNAEIEFEHAGAGFDADDKLHGTAEIEQVWVDFKISDPFNWRAPGVDLVPIGYINQHHEPTQFYSVNRPEIYNGLIPSTFKAPATSIYGTIADGLSYQIQVSSSIEDFGDDFAKRTDANTVPAFPAGYGPGIDGHTALGFARPPLGDFRQLSSEVAVAGKLDFAPAFLPGFAGSASIYYTPNSTPRGAYADTGDLLGRSSLALLDAEFRYRIPQTGFELRGEYTEAVFGNPANLRANNDTDPTNNVGKTMYGYSGEVAYHFALGTILNSQWEAVPFYRYTYENLQTGGFAGTDPNMPTGAGQLQFHTVGIAVFPSPKLVLKATYQKVNDRAPGGANADSVLGGIGFFF